MGFYVCCFVFVIHKIILIIHKIAGICKRQCDTCKIHYIKDFDANGPKKYCTVLFLLSFWISYFLEKREFSTHILWICMSYTACLLKKKTFLTKMVQFLCLCENVIIRIRFYLGFIKVLSWLTLIKINLQRLPGKFFEPWTLTGD